MRSKCEASEERQRCEMAEGACVELLACFALAFARLKKEKINACYAGYFLVK